MRETELRAGGGSRERTLRACVHPQLPSQMHLDCLGTAFQPRLEKASPTGRCTRRSRAPRPASKDAWVRKGPEIRASPEKQTQPPPRRADNPGGSHPLLGGGLQRPRGEAGPRSPCVCGVGSLRGVGLSAGQSAYMWFPGSSPWGGRWCPTHLSGLPETNRKGVKITLEETEPSATACRRKRNRYASGHSLPAPPHASSALTPPCTRRPQHCAQGPSASAAIGPHTTLLTHNLHF